MTTPYCAICLFAAASIVLSGCVTAPLEAPGDDLREAKAGSVLRSLSIDRAVEDRILALDPKRIGEDDVRNTLAKGPAPRIFEVHGGVYPVHLLMESFSEFLTGMGYPEDRIRDPGDGAFSRSPYDDSERQAGEIAWYYEHEGVRPMLVGHSQGGIQIVKILHELAGTFGAARRPFNPLTVVPFVRSIPDTVDDFTGYRIGLDFFAWDAPGFEGVKTFHATGKAKVRNVTLPAEYSHVFVPATAQLALSPEMRAWINAFDPDNETGRAPLPDGIVSNIMWAADVWHSIKEHWCLEAQRLIRAKRAALGTS